MIHQLKPLLPVLLAAQMTLSINICAFAAQAPPPQAAAQEESINSKEQASAGAASTPESRQKAEAILQKCANFYHKAKSFNFEVDTNSTVKLEGDQKDIVIKGNFEISMKRPNKLSIVEVSGDPLMNEQCDGKNLNVYDAETKRYVTVAAPDSVEKVLQEKAFRSGYGCLKCAAIDPILADAPVEWSAFSSVKKNDEVTYLGEDKIEGVAVDKLQISGPKFSEYIYVQQGAEPWLLRITSFDTNVADLPMPGGAPRMVSLSTLANFLHPKANTEIAQSKFEFEAPAGSTKVASFAPSQPVSPLVGKPEFDFDGQLVDGRGITLSKLKNKKVVILDFWATWCQPCRMAMPLVLQVANNYKSKGVAFYTVNEMEDQTKILDFLKSSNLELSVILDVDGNISRHYEANAIPTTIIIDRKGIIRTVHRGYTPEIGDELSAELDEILHPKKSKHKS